MRALTERHPWGWMISHGGKAVENRGWAPPDALLGQRFAIHAGKLPAPGKGGAASADYWDEIAAAVADLDREGLLPLALGPITPRQLLAASSAIACTVRLAGWVTPHARQYRSAMHDDNATVIAACRSPWFGGPVGWVLLDVLALPEPVPCKGAQGLWTLPPDVEAKVLEQESYARAALDKRAEARNG